MNTMEILELIQEGKPLVRTVLNSLKQYEDEWNDVSQFITENVVKIRSSIYKGFIQEGLPPDVALSLTVVSIQDMKDISKSIQTNQKDKK